MFVASSVAVAGTFGSHAEVLRFTTAGRGEAGIFGGYRGRQLQTTADLEGTARAASCSDRAVHVAAFELAPEDLKAALANPQRLQLLLHDVLFDANPDTHDVHKWDPTYRNWDARTQTMIVSTSERRTAFDRFLEISEDRRAPGGHDALADQVETLVDALLGEPTTHFYEVHWDNKDDTEFDGLVALDVVSGRIRVLMSNDFA